MIEKLSWRVQSLSSAIIRLVRRSDVPKLTIFLKYHSLTKLLFNNLQEMMKFEESIRMNEIRNRKFSSTFQKLVERAITTLNIE